MTKSVHFLHHISGNTCLLWATTLHDSFVLCRSCLPTISLHVIKSCLCLSCHNRGFSSYILVGFVFCLSSLCCFLSCTSVVCQFFVFFFVSVCLVCFVSLYKVFLPLVQVKSVHEVSSHNVPPEIGMNNSVFTSCYTFPWMRRWRWCWRWSCWRPWCPWQLGSTGHPHHWRLLTCKILLHRGKLLTHGGNGGVEGSDLGTVGASGYPHLGGQGGLLHGGAGDRHVSHRLAQCGDLDGGRVLVGEGDEGGDGGDN